MLLRIMNVLGDCDFPLINSLTFNMIIFDLILTTKLEIQNLEELDDITILNGCSKIIKFSFSRE